MNLASDVRHSLVHPRASSAAFPTDTTVFYSRKDQGTTQLFGLEVHYKDEILDLDLG